MRPPTSRVPHQIRLNAPDVAAALAAPLLARLARDIDATAVDLHQGAWLYAAVTAATSIAFLAYFRIGGILVDYLCIADLRRILKAVTLGVLAGVLVIFTLNRLDEIPRSIPLLQIAILAALLVGWRLVSVKTGESAEKQARRAGGGGAPDSVLLVGAGRMASTYIRTSAALGGARPRIVALLDADPKLHGRSIGGHEVVGDWAALEQLVSEYATHGVRIDRVVVTIGDAGESERVGRALAPVCADLGLTLDRWADNVRQIAGAVPAAGPAAPPESAPGYVLHNPGYWRVRRAADIVLSLSAIVLLSPLILVAILAATIDVGAPVVFWQDRVGRNGRSFRVYKFRTFQAPFDHDGRVLTDAERLSRIGKWLRATRLDELPQLVNILRGDMTIIGPRPLLPVDQPLNDRQRLAVPPGLTGWAQVNGGKLITAEEKNLLDRWYVRNCGLWLDLRILALTVLTVIRGDSLDVLAARGSLMLANDNAYATAPGEARAS